MSQLIKTYIKLLPFILEYILLILQVPRRYKIVIGSVCNITGTFRALNKPNVKTLKGLTRMNTS